MQTRKFFQYEINWLKKYGFDINNLESIGETPVEYITGHAEFLNRDFLVSSDTLIPRIETEEIIPQALKFLLSTYSSHLNIADIGTGSGCIGITISKELIDRNFLNFDTYLTDISPKALKLAEENAKNLLHSHTNKLHFFVSNLLEQYPTNVKFNLVIANLPYIPTSRIKTLDSSVKDFEPHLALDGGSDGTGLINKLLEELPTHLESNFLVILEIDSTHTLDMFRIPSEISSNIVQDSFHRSRFLILTPK